MILHKSVGFYEKYCSKKKKKKLYLFNDGSLRIIIQDLILNKIRLIKK